jgi:tetratricopeptide (TPR) repeat protein
VAHMLVLADLYVAQGSQDQADEVIQSARQMDPRNPQIAARFGAPAAAAEASPEFDAQTAPEPVQEAIPEEHSFLQEVAPPPLEHPAEITSLDLAPESLIDQMPPAGRPESAADSGKIEFDHPFTPDFPAPDFAGQQGSPVQAVDPVQEQYEELTQSAAEAVEEQDQEPAGSGAVGIPEQHREPEQTAGIDSAPEQPATIEEFDLNEVMAEAEFYYQQGLFDEARKHYEKILERVPDHEKASDRIAEIMRDQEDAQEFSKLAQAVDGLEGLVGLGLPGGAAAEDMKPSASDEEAVRRLMQEISQLKQKEQPPPVKQPRAEAPRSAPQPARPESHRAVPVSPQSFQRRAEEDFFDLGEELNATDLQEEQAEGSTEPEDDFFDLASELRDELSNVSVPASSAAPVEEQSLDDIFEEFKKGVEQQAIKEDVDTHYNLGVAYKEMGLLDDAISEFIMTPENEPKFMQSRYMLGLCYLEKGDYENAIAEILQAIHLAERGGVGLSDRIGMNYDLGLAYQGAGNRDGALVQFQKVYVADKNYREITNKVRELQGGQIVSPSQLKTDIEREISSKFLEEGERIEREEKTRKNERVRS